MSICQKGFSYLIHANAIFIVSHFWNNTCDFLNYYYFFLFVFWFFLLQNSFLFNFHLGHFNFFLKKKKGLTLNKLITRYNNINFSHTSTFFYICQGISPRISKYLLLLPSVSLAEKNLYMHKNEERLCPHENIPCCLTYCLLFIEISSQFPFVNKEVSNSKIYCFVS